MATTLLSSEKQVNAAATAERELRAGLTADTDTLTAVLDDIEQSIALAARPEEVFTSPPRSVLRRDPPCH